MLAGGLILSTLDTQLPDRLSVEMTILEERACFNRGLLTTGRDLLGDGYAAMSKICHNQYMNNLNNSQLVDKMKSVFIILIFAG